MKFCWEMVVTNRCLASLFDNVEDVFLKFYQGKICFLDPLCSARLWYEFPFFSDSNETTLSDLHVTHQKKENILSGWCGKNSPSSVQKGILRRQRCAWLRIDRPSQKLTPEVDNLMKSSFLWCFGGYASEVIRYWELARFLVLIFYSFVGSDFHGSTSNIRLLTWCIENNNLG